MNTITSNATHLRGLLLVILVQAACADGPGSDGTRARQPADLTEIDTLLRVGSTRLYVRGSRGDRDTEPVLVVHGGPLLDHGYLRRAFHPFYEHRAFVYFDQRLSGRSEGVVQSGSVRLDTLVHDIEQIRAALDLGPVHVIGHSWGGLLALKYALEHPARVRSLVLLSPMPPSAALWQEERRLEMEAVTPRDTAGMGAVRTSEALAKGDPKAVEELLRLSFRSSFSDPTRVEDLTFHIEPDYHERSRQFARLAEDLAAYDVTRELSGLFVPTLVVHGADEAGALVGQASLSELPCVRLEGIPDSGHFPFIEQPQIFAETLDRFFEAVEKGSVACESDG